MDVQTKYNDIVLKISAFEKFRSELNTEKLLLERENFNKLFVGKFWKYDRSYEVVYSYCKGSGAYAGMGTFDFFKITAAEMVTFKKDFEEYIYSFCGTEITGQEYNEALEKFKNTFFEFMRVERKTLIEKCK